MKLNMSVEGMRNFERKIAKASEEAKEKIREQTKETAENIQDKAKSNAPVYEKVLKERIVHGTSDDGLSAVVVSKAPHSHLVEFGTGERRHKNGKSTGSMPAQPFMVPAYESEKNKYSEGIKKAFRG